MRKACCAAVLLFFMLTVNGFTSEIGRITLSELYEKADLIVMAEVLQVFEEGDHDQVTIMAEQYLKGEGPRIAYTFTLVTRGGLKDFDPVLKKGDTGVFFLKSKQQTEEVEKAYWGSVAVFTQNHFHLTKEKAGTDTFTRLAAWRSYRVKLGQVQNTEAYNRGFLKGLAGPPGLVDGSADFNLGHSDGMLAAHGAAPDGKNH